MGGMHPVVAVYSTFLNRAFDQIMMDRGAAQAARHRGPPPAPASPATTAPAHNGMWTYRC